ncbi:U4/U6 small nuclear ribonucleoprotein prp4 [Sporothrix eucalyptigena]|uniref:non-specific serine/threonine protein kinase n=1 Tax=Sporothrix eucalyptigena TaxID=1812306 RepID=A0ABP0ATX4_9PEZI
MASPRSSADEGEIVERQTARPPFKAKTSAAAARPDDSEDSFNVDRRNRNPRVRLSRSPDRDRGYAYRNNYSPPRGQKRQRDDRDARDSRWSSSNTGDRRGDRYDFDDAPRRRDPLRSDYDGGRRRDRDGDQLRYDDDYDGDRYSRNAPGKRQRTRSRSPPPSNYPSSSNFRGNGNANGNRGRNERDRRDRDRDFDRNRDRDSYRDDRGRDRNQVRNQNQQGNWDRDRANDREADRRANGDHRDDAQNGSRHDEDQHKDDAPPAPVPVPQEDWVEQAPVDEEAEIERRRRRRQEILQKSRASTPMRALSLAASTPAESASPVSQSVASPGQDDAEAMDLANDQDFMNMLGKQNTGGNNGAAAGDAEDGPSAADYDPTVDMEEDERRDELRHGGTVAGLHGAGRRESLAARPDDKAVQLVEDAKPEDTKDTDADAEDEDDEDDMFAEDFVEKKYDTTSNNANDAAVIGKDGAALAVGALPTAAANGGGILEGDDIHGYYKIRRGEILDGRYQIQSALGKGMFSGVARAWDITTPDRREVAIKIMRNNDALRKGGYTEIAILQKLNEADPENRKHIVRFERSFDFRGHLCMAFENLSMNLREVLKKFGNNVGINLHGVRVYAYQIFVALAHMRRCSIIHADLKPDNILVNSNRSTLKICDLGTAIDRSDAATAHNEITPYLVSRFYRAPEIVLGMPYDYAVDMWSIGCTLYELYTGKILFTGESNNQMLRAIMEVRGKMSAKMYRRGELWRMHFDDNGGFLSQERDKFQHKTTVKTIPIVKPTRDLRTRLMAASAGMTDAESKDLAQFHDLLDRCLNLNPDKRILPSDALKHPFFAARPGR